MNLNTYQYEKEANQIKHRRRGSNFTPIKKTNVRIIKFRNIIRFTVLSFLQGFMTFIYPLGLGTELSYEVIKTSSPQNSSLTSEVSQQISRLTSILVVLEWETALGKVIHFSFGVSSPTQFRSPEFTRLNWMHTRHQIDFKRRRSDMHTIE